jgi:hypothetical protein
MTARGYRLAPNDSRQRGLPSIGLEITAPGQVELTPVGTGAAVVRCCERRAAGRPLGELEVSVFAAALIIDRDGILEETAREVAERIAIAARVAGTAAVSLPGASGFRVDLEPRTNLGPLPYVHVFAMAPHDLGVDGGVIVTVRCARPEWPAAEAILGSLRIGGRRGVVANDQVAHPPLLPIIGE